MLQKARLRDEAIETGADAVRIAGPPLDPADREVDPRAFLIVAHEHPVQARSGDSAGDRDRLGQQFLRQGDAKTRRRGADQHGDRQVAEAGARGPVTDFGLVLVVRGIAQGEIGLRQDFQAGALALGRGDVLAVVAGDLGDRAQHQAGGHRNVEQQAGQTGEPGQRAAE